MDQQEKLIAAYLAGDKVSSELLIACRRDPALLKRLAELSAVDRLINFQCNNDGSELFSAEVTQRIGDNTQTSLVANITAILTKEKQQRFRKLASVIVLVVGVLFSGIYFLQESSRNTELAIVNKAVGAINADQKINTNQIISKGKFQLTDGYAEVELKNGVTLLVEGPATLNLKSGNNVLLEQGSLVAKIPEKIKHFILNTPSSEISEQNSEFGVMVDALGSSQVHALNGNVKARVNNKSAFEYINANQARAFNINQQVNIIKNNPERFMRALPGKSPTTPGYLHWSFDEISNNTFPCSGKGINNKCYHANSKSLVPSESGPKITNGQFGDALYFNGKSTWLETEFPGIGGNNPRTVAFWVKVPSDFSIKKGYGILSWGLSSTQSAWQISPNPAEKDGPLGRIRIGTNKAQVIGTTDIRDRRWHHVAIVLFGGEQADLSTHILLYLDGKLERSSTKSIAKVFTELSHPKSRPLIIGRNIAFTNNKSKMPYKFFKGWLDEIFIFDAALDQQQIQNLMQFNRISTTPKTAQTTKNKKTQ